MNIFKILFILWFSYSQSNPKPHFLQSYVKSFSISTGTAALIFASHPDALALSSGSRSGGSSFRSSSQSRSFASPSPRMYAQPQYYSPMYIPFSYVPVNFDVVVVGTLSYVVFQAVSNKMRESSDFSNNKASIIKLQIALDTDWSESENIIENLNFISANANSLNKQSDIADLLSKAALVLLRKSTDWNSAAYESEMLDSSKAELYFQKLAITERAKYDKETTPSLNRGINTNISNKSQVVVSLIVTIKGESDAYQKKQMLTISELRSCLQSLAYEALNDSGENIMALELSWSPSEPGTIITERDLIQDYPELVKL